MSRPEAPKLGDGAAEADRAAPGSLCSGSSGSASGMAPDESSAESLATRIWREHRGWVAAVIRANMPRGADADDLLQEVAVKLVLHIDSMDSPDRIGPWLRTVATNLARTAGRRYVRTQRIFQPMNECEPESNWSDRGESTARGRHALAIAETLPLPYREPLLLSLRGLSYKQIGLTLDLPVSTIETRLSRARAMVREELRAADGRDEHGGAGSAKYVRSFQLKGAAPAIAEEGKP